MNIKEALISLPANINDELKFTDNILAVFNDTLALYDGNEVTGEYRITDFTEFKVNIYVGNGLLEAMNGDKSIAVCKFSMEYAAKYAFVCKELNKQLKGETPDYTNIEPERKCPTCGRVYPSGTRVCIKCVNKRDTFKKLVGLIDKKFAVMLIICFAMMLAISVISLISPYLYRVLVDDIFMTMKADYRLFAGIIISIIAAQTVSVALQVAKGRTATVVSNGIADNLRRQVFSKIEKLSLSFINKKKTGDLMHRVTNDTDRVRNFIQNDMMNLALQIITLVAVTALLFCMNWRMAILIIVPTPVMMFAIRIFRRKIRSIYRIQWRLSARANSILQDILSGMRIVKAFGKENDEVARYKKASRAFTDRNIYNETFWATVTPIFHFILSIGTYMLYLYGGYRVIGGDIGLGELLQFSNYANLIYGPLGFMTRLPKIIADTFAAAGRIFEVLDEDFEIADKEDAVELDNLEGRVRLDNVCFGYKSYLPVLNNISLDVKPGEMIGLVGHSGSGKSTLINLIMRFYNVDSGAIYIDDVNLNDISSKALRSRVGVVLQETFLFSGTIRENIAFSKPDATDAEIIAAAKIANAHDFITKFPDGYDTRLGERGQNISGGEKQRIAIARAIIHDPKILILDEATSSLDTDTEFLIQEALARLIKGRTTFAIAHRLATLKNADRLLVLDHGNLAEIGTHEELLKKKWCGIKKVDSLFSRIP